MYSPAFHLKAVKAASTEDELEAARQLGSSMVVLPDPFWIDWITDKLEIGDLVAAESVAAQAIIFRPTIPVLVEVIKAAGRLASEGFNDYTFVTPREDPSVSAIRFAEAALDRCSLLPDSGPVWDEMRTLLRSLNRFKDAQKVTHRQLASTPLSENERLRLIDAVDSASSSSSPPTPFAAEINGAFSYIYSSHFNPSDLIRSLPPPPSYFQVLNRAVLEYPHQPVLWRDLLSLEGHQAILERAVRALPQEHEFWLALLLQNEKQETLKLSKGVVDIMESIQSIRMIMDRAVAALWTARGLHVKDQALLVTPGFAEILMVTPEIIRRLGRVGCKPGEDCLSEKISEEITLWAIDLILPSDLFWFVFIRWQLHRRDPSTVLTFLEALKDRQSEIASTQWRQLAFICSSDASAVRLVYKLACHFFQDLLIEWRAWENANGDAEELKVVEGYRLAKTEVKDAGKIPSAFVEPAESESRPPNRKDRRAILQRPPTFDEKRRDAQGNEGEKNKKRKDSQVHPRRSDRQNDRPRFLRVEPSDQPLPPPKRVRLMVPARLAATDVSGKAS